MRRLAKPLLHSLRQRPQHPARRALTFQQMHLEPSTGSTHRPAVSAASRAYATAYQLQRKDDEDFANNVVPRHWLVRPFPSSSPSSSKITDDPEYDIFVQQVERHRGRMEELLRPGSGRGPARMHTGRSEVLGAVEEVWEVLELVRSVEQGEIGETSGSRDAGNGHQLDLEEVGKEGEELDGAAEEVEGEMTELEETQDPDLQTEEALEDTLDPLQPNTSISKPPADLDLPTRQREARALRSARRRVLVNSQLGPHAHLLSLAIREIYPPSLPSDPPNAAIFAAEERQKIEGVARWCYVQSFRPLNEDLLPKSGLSEVRDTPNGGADGAKQLARRARVAYLRMIEDEIRLAAKAKEAGKLDEASGHAARVLDSVEAVMDEVRAEADTFMVKRLSLSHTPIHPRTQVMLGGAFQSRYLRTLRDLLATWVKVNYELVEEKDRRGLSSAMLELKLYDLGEKQIPLGSKLYEAAIAEDKGKADELEAENDGSDEITATAGKEEQVDSAYLAYVEKLSVQPCLRSSYLSRVMVSASVTKGDWESVLKLWAAIRDAYVAQLQGHSNATEATTTDPEPLHEEQVDVLMTFLRAFLRANTLTGKTAQIELAIQDAFTLLPKTTPPRVYHQLLWIFGGKHAGSMPGSAREAVSHHLTLRNIWEKMRRDGVEKDLGMYRVAVQGFAGQGDVEGIKRCWEELRGDKACRDKWKAEVSDAKNTIYPPIDTLNVFIGSLFSTPKPLGGRDFAITLYDFIRDPTSPYTPDIVTINILLRHYVSIRDFDSVTKTMAELPSLNLRPDVITYTTIVEGLLKNGKRDVARSTLDIMEADGIAPSVQTYGLLIADLAKGGTDRDMQRAEELIKRMAFAKLRPTVITYTAMLGGYFRINNSQQGMAVLKRMERDGILMNRITYNMILRILVNNDVDGEVMRRGLKRATRGRSHFRSAGSGANLPGAWGAIVETMLSRNITPNQDTWYIILAGLQRAGRGDEAREAMMEMERQGFKVHPGTALARMVGNVQRGRADMFRRMR